MSKRIIEILMRRDKMTKSEAQKEVSAVQSMIDEILAQGECEISSIVDAEEIILHELRLEPDYLEDFLF